MNSEQSAGFTSDLIILAADADLMAGLNSLLPRHESLGIKQIKYEMKCNPLHDSCSDNEIINFFRPFNKTHRYALVVFDLHGCGRENKTPVEIEGEITKLLEINGWKDRCSAIVIEPELESWVWSDSPETAKCLGWDKSEELRDWLESTGRLATGETKPADPKTAYVEALRKVGKRKSASIFGMLGSSLGISRCVDPSFARLRRILTDWFAA